MLKQAKQERLIWLDIMLTLLTLELMAYFYYGLRALVLGGVCITVSAAAEFISLRLMHKRFTADDLTCTSDALIIALMLPTVIDYKIAAIGCVFAVVAAKNIFGGRLNMIFSPAAAAYVFLLTSWKNQTLQFTAPHVHTGIFEKATGLVTSASHSFNLTGEMSVSDFEILMGNFSGPAGAVSILLLAVAALILILRGDISGGAFIGTISGTVLLSYLVPMSGGMVDSIKFPLVTNMVLFAAVYIVSDKRIAPRRHYYAFFYGLFIAMTSYIIVLTTAKENAIVIVALLFTPIALAFKNLEKRIDDLEIQARSEAAQKSEITAEEETEAAPEPEEISKPDDSLDEEAFDLPEFSINEINELIEAEHLADTDEEQNAEEVTGDEE
ncbi:MAG: RnfABCDGE type electron transport complex subunit D [Ruminococcus sp.]|nr:RnfABCDGE type electron transport complex subunit D [Ruminococcus sp.]